MCNLKETNVGSGLGTVQVISPYLKQCLHISLMHHVDVIKCKHFPRYWPFVRGIHRSPVNSPHKGQWRRALMFSLICVWINGWVNNREAGDLRRYRAHYDVIVMIYTYASPDLNRLWWTFYQQLKPLNYTLKTASNYLIINNLIIMKICSALNRI